MAPLPADLIIDARWIAPMAEKRLVLEHHSLVVKHGQILDVLPQSEAMIRYTPTLHLQRPHHLLMPGLINAHTSAAVPLHDTARPVASESVRERVHGSIARMLRAGITCFGNEDLCPQETAAIAAAQGIRVRIGLPILDTASPWASTTAEYVGNALSLRDEFKGHPLITTAFALHSADRTSDATLDKVRTLADELDAAVVMELPMSPPDPDASGGRRRTGCFERLERLGMLTPSFHAAGIARSRPEDIELARRGGISISLSPVREYRATGAVTPLTDWTRAGIVAALGTGAWQSFGHQDLWRDAHMVRFAGGSASAASVTDVWDLLTRGGAAALGLSDQVGSLESGKWADICCLDLTHPAVFPVHDLFDQLLSAGGRDLVSDVWVGGRQLVADGQLTRMPWPEVAVRAQRSSPTRVLE